MTSLNPLHTTLQNLYNQLSNQVQSTKPGLADADVFQRLGVPAGLVQDLRNDVKAVVDGHDPEKAVANLLKGLQKFQAFVRPESSHNYGMAKEWPADKELPTDAKSMAFVKGEDGKPVAMAQEWPAGKELPADAKSMAFVKGEDGKPVAIAQEWPAGKELPADAKSMAFVKGEDGKPVAIAQEWPAGKEIPAGTKFKELVKGADGKPSEVASSEMQRREWESTNSSVQTISDTVVSKLKAFLNAEANGTNLVQVSADLRSALQSLFDNGALVSNPDMVRNALRNSVQSQA